MKVNDELYVLEVPMDAAGERIMNLSVIVDKDHGLTLVDTGVPTQAGLIIEKLEAEGLSESDVKQIVLTHQDLDHIGSLHALKERTGATVYAYVDEIPYIDGTLRPIKWPSKEMIEQNPIIAERLQQFQFTTVDAEIQDGETLANSANAQAIATPGHTPGHMSLYLPSSKTLISGDALISENGVLMPPMERATPNMVLAMESLKKLLNLDIETIVCYHGGLVNDDAAGQLRRVAA